MATLISGIEEQTAAYLIQFAALPPRENQTLDDLRSDYKAELIRCAGAPDESVDVRPIMISTAAGELASRLYIPSGSGSAQPLMIYVHGGGFAVGDLDSHDGLVRLIASASGLRVLALDYRRAPEAPFPAARDDVLAAVRWAAAHAADLDIDPARIILGGESAGAAHAMTAALALQGSATPAAAVWILSPALDATLSGSSYAEFAEGTGRTAAEFAYLWSLYVPDAGMRADPEVSPALAPLSGCPPLFIYPAEFDPARSDGEDFAARAQAAGVPVVLRRRSGLIHQYPEITGVSGASRAAVVDAAREIARHFA